MTNEDRGEQGRPGRQGETGAAGEAGSTGARGVEGPEGAEGARGGRGVRGIRGSSGGPEGPRGPSGGEGEQGEQGEMGEPGKQGEKGITYYTTSRFDKGIVVVMLILFLCSGVGVFAAFETRGQADRIEVLAKANGKLARQSAANAQVRKQEDCKRDEQQEATMINQVINTYAFVDDAPRGYDPVLLRAIVRGAGNQYKAALSAKAAPYCDAPGVGLPERGEKGYRGEQPKLPKRRKPGELLK